ncbi:TonB family protein [Brucella sp. BE17]|uniref:TonB family protein n=1 Tax=Brucella sp. BE17 TaxID=3142977 RepID=UPI0031BA1EEA
MQIQSCFRARVMFGSLLVFALSAMPTLAETVAPEAPVNESEKTPPTLTQPAPSGTGPRLNQPPPITNQAEWKNAVAQTLRRRAARLTRTPELRELDGEFKVTISFSLSPEGNASEVKIVSSSGQPLVDAAAQKIFADEIKFPAFTHDMNKSEPMKLTAPLQFMLEKPEAPPEPAEQPAVDTAPKAP